MPSLLIKGLGFKAEKLQTESKSLRVDYFGSHNCRRDCLGTTITTERETESLRQRVRCSQPTPSERFLARTPTARLGRDAAWPRATPRMRAWLAKEAKK